MKLPFRNEARTDTHTLELLNEQFACIWNLNRTKVRRVATAATGPDMIFGIYNRNETARMAAPATERV